MKTKRYIVKGLATCLIAAGLSGCVDLDPKAMSFLTPENTFVDKDGVETMLRLCRKQMNFEWFGNAFMPATVSLLPCMICLVRLGCDGRSRD